MKKLTVLWVALILSLSVSAQWQYRAYSPKSQYNFKQDLNITVPITLMLTGFTYNEVTMHTDKFATYSQVEKNQTMLAGYLSTAIVCIGTHYIWKGIQNKKHHKRFFD